MCCTLTLLDTKHTPSRAVENLLKGTSSAPMLGLPGWGRSQLLEGEALSPSQGVTGAMVCYGEAHQVNVAVGPSQLHCPTSRFLWVLGVYCLGASSTLNMWLCLIIGVHGLWWDGPGGHHSPSLCRVLPGKESPASQHPASSPSSCVCGCPKCVWLGRLQGKSAWWGSGLSGVFGAGLGCTGSRVRRLCSYPIVSQTLSWLISCRPLSLVSVYSVRVACCSRRRLRNQMTNTSFVLC